MRPASSSSIARTGLWFAYLAPLVYLSLRALERSTGVNADPGTIARSLHVAFLWRIALALWLAGAIAYGVGRARVSLDSPAERRMALGALWLAVVILIWSYLMP